jgi:hypothetical protein
MPLVVMMMMLKKGDDYDAGRVVTFASGCDCCLCPDGGWCVVVVVVRASSGTMEQASRSGWGVTSSSPRPHRTLAGWAAFTHNQVPTYYLPVYDRGATGPSLREKGVKTAVGGKPVLAQWEGLSMMHGHGRGVGEEGSLSHSCRRNGPA